MHRLNRLAAILRWTMLTLTVALIVVLVCSTALAWRRPYPDGPAGVAFLIGLFGPGIVWPACVLIAGAGVGALGLAAARPELRTRGTGAAVLLAIVGLHAAWVAGVRPPVSRTGVFAGEFVYGHMGFRPDFFVPCQEPARPLPRGADLLKGAMEPGMPILAAVDVPERGWHGAHPRRWPATESDSHGTRHWLVRVRGRLTGPAQYGTPALMQYRLDVDTVLEVSPKRTFQDECGVYDPPPGPP